MAKFVGRSTVEGIVTLYRALKRIANLTPRKLILIQRAFCRIDFEPCGPS